MENQTTAPAQGKMEQRDPLLYKFRTPVMLSQYEMYLLIESLGDANKRLRSMINEKTDDESLYHIGDMLMRRTELADRIKQAKDDQVVTPF
jgi:hypothetical protein